MCIIQQHLDPFIFTRLCGCHCFEVTFKQGNEFVQLPKFKIN